MPRTSTFQWIVEKLEDNDNVTSTEIISDSLLRINRREGQSITVTTTPLSQINLINVISILKKQNVDFILHSVKEAWIYGGVFDYLDKERKVIGSFGDLFRIIDQNNNYPYLPTEVHFIVRGLEQHKKVNNVKRLDNKRYEIERYGLNTVIIIALNDYDISIESVRSAVNDFDKFDIILKSNPNGQITSSAANLADSSGFKVVSWGQLLSILHRRWN
ncbi:hypothetical protein JM84_0019 [Dokdonia sp. Hel_I_63]|uniref:hypothetical protein n=1 Tax=Dokdonia sp. Hel_I_63 TaxID=1249996 RepID=UPI00119C3137|nr:hypothetical protein [Dokdonia sp. Hel_I_63]TVZ21152.1 hypothetical protein JM84_0019 [Dokdonia sp. Hel_I_63]